MLKADRGGALGHSAEASKLYCAIVRARFNDEITCSMQQACHAELVRLGVKEKHIDTLEVPGALEIPVVLQALARKNEYDALIAIGCVIRGQTWHFELVSNESAHGIAQVALRNEVPILNAVLTVENPAQAQERAQPKAVEAAQGAVEMALLINDLA